MTDVAIRRLDYLDALRGVAVLLVLLVHTQELAPDIKLPSTIFNFVNTSKYGVQLFFEISAFTIFYTLKKTGSTAADFYIKRFFRIAPLYFVALLFFAVWYKSPTAGILINGIFLHGFSPKYINSIVPGGWSVGIEMLFYLIAPFLFSKIKNLGQAIFFLNITLTFRFLINYGVSSFHLLQDSAGQSYYYFWLPNQLPLFALGIIVYFIISDDRLKKEDLLKPATHFIFIWLFSLMTMLSIIQEHIIAGFIWALLIILLSNLNSSLLVNKITLFMGKISYSVYLSQYAVILILKDIGYVKVINRSSVLFDLVNFGINYLILAFICTGISYLLFIMIERPFQKFGRTLINMLKPQAAELPVKTV